MTNKFLIFFFLTISIFAQDPKLSDDFDIAVGEEYEETDGFKEFYKHKDYVVAVSRHKDHLIIQKFDPITLKEINRIEHSKFFKDRSTFNRDPSGIPIDKITQLGDVVLLFFAKWNKKEQVESLDVQIISLETLEMREQKEFIRQEGKIAGDTFVFNYFNSKTLDKYNYEKSFDGNNLLIEYRLKPKSRDDSESYDRMSINVFDTNLKLTWKSEVDMPYTEKEMDNVDYAIDKKGNFYMLARVFDDDTTDEKKKDKDEANYHLELFKVKKNTDKIIVNQIELGDKFIDELALYEDSEGNIVIAGTSKNPDSKSGLFSKEKGQATGIFTIKLNDEGEMTDFKNYDFPLQLLKKHATKKEKKDIKKKDEKNDESPSFENLKINEIAINNDGSFVIHGEQSYIVVRTSRSGSTSYSYYYRDIFAAKIDENGKLVWMHKLPKFQRGVRGKGTMSYTHMFSGNNHYLLYLDNVKNLTLKEDEFPYQHSDGHGGYFTAYIINDTTGEVKKEAIFNTLDINGTELEHFRTDKILPLSDSEILIEGFEGRNKDFLVKVTAKE